MASYVSPSLTTNDSLDSRRVHPESLRKPVRIEFLIFPRMVESTNQDNVSFGKKPDIFSTCRAPFRASVPRVIPSGSCEKMQRIEAWGIVAAVKNIWRFLCDFLYEVFIGNPMCTHILVLPWYRTVSTRESEKWPFQTLVSFVGSKMFSNSGNQPVVSLWWAGHVQTPILNLLMRTRC